LKGIGRVLHAGGPPKYVLPPLTAFLVILRCFEVYCNGCVNGSQGVTSVLFQFFIGVSGVKGVQGYHSRNVELQGLAVTSTMRPSFLRVMQRTLYSF
jgi:hypothetical protein